MPTLKVIDELIKSDTIKLLYKLSICQRFSICDWNAFQGGFDSILIMINNIVKKFGLIEKSLIVLIYSLPLIISFGRGKFRLENCLNNFLLD